MKCYHHNDLDGRCAASIVYREEIKRGHSCELIEVDYKDEIDISAIKQGERLYIVDFSFKPEVMREVLRKTKNIVWIDHHKTAKEYDYGRELDGIREFEEKKFAGCELTWMYFNPNSQIPYGIRLIGDRDCWRWSFGDDTKYFNEGIKIYNTNPKSDIWNKILDRERVNRIIENGIICVKYRNKLCADYRKSYAFETVFEGYKCLAVGIYMFGSELFSEDFKNYDICLSYEFLGDKWIVGLYSENVDVSIIAKKYGGGGHRGASGFICDKLPFKSIGIGWKGR